MRKGATESRPCISPLSTCHRAHLSPQLDKSGGEDEIDFASGLCPNATHCLFAHKGLTERVLISSFGIYPCPRVTLPTCPLD